MRFSRWASLTVVILALVVLSPQGASAQVHPASSGAYGNSVTGPAIYQTNLPYQSSDMVPLSGTPSGGTLTTVYYSWSYLTYTAGYRYYYWRRPAPE
jgi:hypothetical protein